MRIRDKLVRSRRRYLALVFGGMGIWAALILAIVSIAEQGPSDWLFIAAIPIFGMIVLGFIGINFLVRCPRCKGNLGRAGQLASPPLFGRSVKNCPFCSVSLDESVAR